MTKKQKKNLGRIIVAAFLLIVLALVETKGATKAALYAVPYLVVGYDILLKAMKGIKNRRPMDESLLMVIATLGAFALAVYDEETGGEGDYREAVAVMLFYQIGEWFQSYAVGRSRQNIADLMDIRPDYANVEEDGRLVKIGPDEVEIGTLIVVQPGEKIPLDGVVEEGNSALNTAALTGESLPRDVKPGDEVLSGCISLSGLLKIRTTKEFDESTAAKILDIVENASSAKSQSEHFITRFARVYTPAVVFSALLLAIIPPLARLLALGAAPEWGTWGYRALTFLVISCPCALVISIPLSFFAGLGAASRAGILIKGSNYLEALAGVKTVVMDKTGTLTRGVFDVDAVHPEKIADTAMDILHLAAHVERYSTHPIASSLREAYPHEKDDCTVEDVTEIAGQGIKAKVNGQTVYVGNDKLMESIGAKWHPCTREGATIHVALGSEYIGHIIIADVIKPGAKGALLSLKQKGVNRLVMLTGDMKKVAAKVAAELGIDEYQSELLPADKVTALEKILAASKGEKYLSLENLILAVKGRHETVKAKTAFVGDGINDAPVLARADVGIAMGAMGSDAAIEAADVVLMDDNPGKIAVAIGIAQRCMTIVKQNIYFAVGVKFACLALGAIGLANMWLAIFADVGVMVLAILNAMRLLWQE
ncbi:MAG: cadmium-translocating P-type ATPase [Selenomonadaceae bacterium]|nr:cadmium-translocating P-type ATPase [Selenomonadaceae bacterium]